MNLPIGGIVYLINLSKMLKPQQSPEGTMGMWRGFLENFGKSNILKKNN